MAEPVVVTRAPYGSWPSPLTIEAALAVGADVRELCADGTDLVWIESVPEQDGRRTAMRLRHGRVDELTPLPIDVRNRVNEYGGGALHARGGSVAWCDDHDGSVWLLTPDGSRHRLAGGGDRYRFGDLRVAPELPAVLAVREEAVPGAPSVTTIVALPWPGSSVAREAGPEGAGEVVRQGADFYACPEPGPDGRLAWVEWNHPNMPWDASQVWIGTLRVTGGHVTVHQAARLAGGGERPETSVSAHHPVWLPDRRLAFMSDASGYWNLHLWDGQRVRAVHQDPYDFDWPAWQLGNHAFAMLDADLALVNLCDDGVVYLATIQLSSGLVTRAASVASVSAIASVGGTGYALVGRPTEAPALVRLTADGTLELVRQASVRLPPPAYTAVPRSISFTGQAGTVQAWYYPPTNPGWRGLERELPPLLVHSHGGPTGFAADAWQANVQFWTSRGLAVLDVNYSGSAGFGRAYRNRLWGRWGLLDVDDCIGAVRAVLETGLADAARVAISGGSAGGYTTLQALTSTDAFAAGVSSFGVGDLELLARDTHKFESHYLDRLVGPYPARRDLYLQRSPVYHLDALRTPMLILQGTIDRVVPPAQATALAQAVRDRGLPVALLLFEGEGHGFRKLASRRAALSAELSFYAQMFGFTPADQIEPLAIENLPAPETARRAELTDDGQPA